MTQKKVKKRKTTFHSEKARRRTLRRRNPFFKNLLARGSHSTSKYSRQPIKPKFETLAPPEIFSIQKNTIETLRFFENLVRIVHRDSGIFLDLSQIEFITEDALLYLLSRLNFLKSTIKRFQVFGTYPKKEQCKELFLNSRFTDYISSEKKYSNKSDYFPIINGFIADPEVVKKILQYIHQKINLTFDNRTRMYEPILECMTNSKHHAYKIETDWNQWWIIAVPDRNKKIIHLTILDNGFGIPTTIQKKLSEIATDYLTKYINSQNRIDSDLIISALNGDFRTQTRQEERGTGLPTMYEATELSQVESLTIISNYAYIKVQNKEYIDNKILSLKFHGTLIAWDLCEELE